MTILLPFLPLYVEQLGVTDPVAIVQWSGVAYGAAFLTAAIFAPLWGRLGDQYGRKLMLIRASLGMAVAMSLIGLSQNIYQLVGLRLLTGLLGGYSSGSTVLVATQTPRARTAWAIGMMASGNMAGNLVGPLVGGALPRLIGIRMTFFAAGAIIFVAFLATVFLIKEEPRQRRSRASRKHGAWAAISDKRPVVAMLAMGMLLMFANMSIEPIITVYVAQITADPAQVTVVAGLVMSAAALGSILSASRLGKLADRIGHWTVIIGCLSVCAGLLVPQAFVNARLAIDPLAVPDGVVAGWPAALRRHGHPPQRSGTECWDYFGLLDVLAVRRSGHGAAGRRVHRGTLRYARRVLGDVSADGGGGRLWVGFEASALAEPGPNRTFYLRDGSGSAVAD